MEYLKTFHLKCALHGEREIRYFCLDNACFENCCLCILCLKNIHSQCKNEFIITKSQFESKTEFLASDPVKIQILKNNVKDIIDEMRAYSAYKIKALLTNKSKKLREIPVEELKAWGAIELVRYLKANFTPTTSTSALEFTSKYSCTSRELSKSIQAYFKEIDFVVAEFAHSLSLVAVLNSNILKVQNFVCHENIQIRQVQNDVEFSRFPGTSTMYCAAVLDFPVREAVLKVTVLGINSSDRFLEMGFFDKAKYDNVKTTAKMIHSLYGGGGYAFCGYSSTKLSGATPTTNSSSAKGHEIGREYLVKISRSNSLIEITTPSKDVALEARDVDPDTEYYFYVVLFHEESACRVSLVSLTK